MSNLDAVLNRIEWAKQVGAQMPPGFNAAALADAGMGPLLSSACRTAMARAEIAAIQREVLVAALRRQDARVDVGVAREAAALAAIGRERGDVDAHRHAGVAAAAMRAVHDVAGAAEAGAQRVRIQLGQAFVAGIEHEVAGDAFRPVAAGMLAGMEHPQPGVAPVAAVVVGAVHGRRIAPHAGSFMPRAAVRALNAAGAGSTRSPARR